MARARRKPPRYNPAGVTSYPSRAAFNQEVNRRAQSQIQPGLSDIATRHREEVGSHKTRVGDIQGYYNFDLGARQAAQTRLQDALTGILNRNDVLGSGAQEGLAAALRTSAAPNDAAAAQLGVAGPKMDPQLAASLAAYGKADSMGLAGDVAGSLTRGAADIGLAGVGERQAGLQEEALNKANLQGLTRERSGLMSTLGGLRSQSRQALMQELLANSQNKLAWRQFGEGRTENRFQNRLANRQLGETVRSNRAGEHMAGRQLSLAQRQFGEQRRSNMVGERMNRAQLREQTRASKAQERIARKNARLDQQRVDIQRAQVVANQGQSQAKKFDSAVEFLGGYLKPTDLDYKLNQDGKKVFDPKAYNSRISFNDALDQVMRRFGMDSLTAYQILGTASIPAWRRKADAYAVGYTAGQGYARNPAYSGRGGRPR